MGRELNRVLGMVGPLAFMEKTVREIMTTDVVTLSLNDTLRMADDMMALASLRYFPVLEARKVVGVVSWLDLIRASLASAVTRGEQPLREALGTVAIRDVTMAPPISISPDRTIRDAARLMVEKRIDCLLVIEEDSLVGLATRTDLLREMAKL